MTMTNFPQSMLNEYYFGDAIPKLKSIPDKSVDLVFTSLPDISQTTLTKVDDYNSFQRIAVTELCRIVKDTGFVVISQKDRKIDGMVLTNHIWYHNLCIENGLHLKDVKIIAINSKNSKKEFNPVSDIFEHKSLYTFGFQYYQCFTRKGTFARKGEFLKDIIADNQSRVETQYVWSQKFCKLVIQNLTESGDIVVDPFACTGNVLFAAKSLGRAYWGAEIQEKYYNTNFDRFSFE